MRFVLRVELWTRRLNRAFLESSMRKFLVPVAIVATGFMATASHAAIDVSTVVTDLGEVKTAVLSIGVAVLAIAVGIKLYKWVKAAL